MFPTTSPRSQRIIKEIEQVDELELDDIIHAVTARYNALRTDRDLGFLALSTDPKLRDKELDDIAQFIRTCYNRL